MLIALYTASEEGTSVLVDDEDGVAVESENPHYVGTPAYTYIGCVELPTFVLAVPIPVAYDAVPVRFPVKEVAVKLPVDGLA